MSKIVLKQAVVLSDLVIVEMRSKEIAESLTSEGGVRRWYNIPYDKMPYFRHYRRDSFDTIWEFSNYPFKKLEVILYNATKER